MSSSSSPTADRNLLFGVLALQLNFVTRDALVAAMHAWVLDKTKPLGQILLDQGRLTAGQFQALEALLGEHLQAHGSPLESLRSLAPGSEVRSAIESIDDPELATCSISLRPAAEEIPTSREGGRYRVLRPHARGGLGEVFLAEDTELHREVALKEIQEEYADDPARRHRFILEAEVTGGLEHPGIVPVYGLGVYSDGRPHYAMRFIRGRSFREEIDAFHAADELGRDLGERRLAFRALLGRFIDVCNAIAYAHSRQPGQVHGRAGADAGADAVRLQSRGRGEEPRRPRGPLARVGRPAPEDRRVSGATCGRPPVTGRDPGRDEAPGRSPGRLRVSQIAGGRHPGIFGPRPPRQAPTD